MRHHRNSKHYEPDASTWPDDARYVCRQYPGAAIVVYGWETEPDADTEWSGYETRTGQVLVVMVGDDHKFTVDPADLTMLAELDYCASCGQVGCGHDGRDRSAEV